MTVSHPRAKATAKAWLLAMVLALGPIPAFPQAATDPTPPQFRDLAEERRFHALASELRCVMCQNQSLADSNAMIARDLRTEVLELMREGRTDAQIKAFLVRRYGDFVLYKPRMDPKTWLLWFGPVLLLLVGGLVVYRIVRARSAGQAVPADDRQEW
jgi:cytochrome c-type biogenesis protein CcmH